MVSPCSNQSNVAYMSSKVISDRIVLVTMLENIITLHPSILCRSIVGTGWYPATGQGQERALPDTQQRDWLSDCNNSRLHG